MGESTLIQSLIDRLLAGDVTARDDLLTATCERLQKLTRKMLGSYPNLRRWEQTDDVLQNASMRLCRAMNDAAPKSPRHYFHLAAVQIRRELIDMSRHHFGPQGPGAHHLSDAGGPASSAAPAHERPDHSSRPSRLAIWGEFHRHVEALPSEEREVFDLIWYQGLSQAEAMSVLNMSERTLQRLWRSARLKMYDACQGEVPGL